MFLVYFQVRFPSCIKTGTGCLLSSIDPSCCLISLSRWWNWNFLFTWFELSLLIFPMPSSPGWPKSAFSHLSASQVTSLASHPPLPPGLPPRSRSRSRYVFSGSGIFQQSRVRAQLSLSPSCPSFADSTQYITAHSRSSVSCQTRLRVSKLCRWPGSQRTLKCWPPLFCARCFTCAQNSWIKCWLKQTEKGNILMETWYWRSRLCWKSRSTQDFLLPGDN